MHNAFSVIKAYFPQGKKTKACLAIGFLGLILGVFVLMIPLTKDAQENVVISLASPQVEVMKRSDDIPRVLTAPSPVLLKKKTISVNSSSQEELESLPLIGAKKAEQIIQLRPYTTLKLFFEKLKLSKSQQEKLADLISI